MCIIVTAALVIIHILISAVHIHMKQNKSHQLSSLAAGSMGAYTPNKIYHTLLKTVDLILFPLKSV